MIKMFSKVRDSSTRSARGASPLLPAGKSDPTISTSGFLRSSPLDPATVEPLLSLSACSRCRTNASSSRCMSSSIFVPCTRLNVASSPSVLLRPEPRKPHILTSVHTAPHPVQNVPTPLLWRSHNCLRGRASLQVLVVASLQAQALLH